MEYLIPWIAGSLGVPFMQFVKMVFTMSEKTTLWITFIVSFLLGAIAVYITGGFNIQTLTPEVLINSAGAAFSAATLIYKTLVKKEAKG